MVPRETFANHFGDLTGRKLDEFVALLAGAGIKLGLVGFSVDRLADEVWRSLLLVEFLDAAESWTDVGSGAGLPGIPLAIVRGGGTLIEPHRRAVGFLERVARELEMEATEIIPATAEQVSKGPRRESFDPVFARALAKLPIAAELCSPLVRVGGRLILTASSRGRPPVSKDARQRLGLGEFQTMELAHRDIHQVVHIVQKAQACGSEFPRRTAAFKRKPLA